jgi:hypothetical protein
MELIYMKQDFSTILEVTSIQEVVLYLKKDWWNCLADEDVFYLDFPEPFSRYYYNKNTDSLVREET